MTQPAAFGAETSRWPDTRQNWATTTPSGPQNTSPSAPPSGWPPLKSTSLPGLEYLTHLDKLLVDQMVKWFRPLPNYEYVVMDDAGGQIFHLKEDRSRSSWNRFWYRYNRHFKISAIDMSNREVLRLQRTAGWFKSDLEVYAGDVYLGKIKENWSLWHPEFDIIDDRGNVVFQISGSFFRCWGTQGYKVYSADASRQVGLISKQCATLFRQLTSTADYISVSFPLSIDVKQKALLLGATILIDFVHFAK